MKQTGETDSLKSCFCSYLLVFPTSNTPCHDRPRGQADTCAWQLRAGKGGWAEPWSSSVSQHCPRAAHERLALTHPEAQPGQQSALITAARTRALLAPRQPAQPLQRSSFICHAKESLGTFSLLSLLAPAPPATGLNSRTCVLSLTQLINDASKGE